MVARAGAVIGCSLALAHCGRLSSTVDPKYGVSASPRVVQLGEPVPKGGGVYRVGKPYKIGGRTYEPEENTSYRSEGIASWYGEDFHGRLTANGEVYDMDAVSAAHPTLPIPSYARVTNLGNKRSIIVRVNDRGPYHGNRVIDVSVRTAKLLGFYDKGTARVRVEYVGPASLAGSDDSKLEATLRRGTPAPGLAEVQVASTSPLPTQVSEGPSAARGSMPALPNRRIEVAAERMPVRKTQPELNSEITAAARRPPESGRWRSAASPQAASEGGPSTFAARFGPAADLPVAGAPVEQVPAFTAAPARPPASAAIVTGRGLY